MSLQESFRTPDEEETFYLHCRAAYLSVFKSSLMNISSKQQLCRGKPVLMYSHPMFVCSNRGCVCVWCLPDDGRQARFCHLICLMCYSKIPMNSKRVCKSFQSPIQKISPSIETLPTRLDSCFSLSVLSSPASWQKSLPCNPQQILDSQNIQT